MKDSVRLVFKVSSVFIIACVLGMIFLHNGGKMPIKKFTAVSCVGIKDTGQIKIMVIVPNTSSLLKHNDPYSIDYDHKKPICVGDSVLFVQLQSSNFVIWTPVENGKDTIGNVVREGVVTEIQKIP